MDVVYKIDIQKPFIVGDVLPADIFKGLQQTTMKLWSDSNAYDKSFGRHQFFGNEFINKAHHLLTEKAREHFKSSTLIPSWALLSIYEGDNAKLWRHKDDNACTYHIDLCVFQKEPWGLYVLHEGEEEEYVLEEGQGLFMYGNDQEHWRGDFPSPKTNLVANAFFFFCEPDHWYFTEGPQYLDTHIRAAKTSKM